MVTSPPHIQILPSLAPHSIPHPTPHHCFLQRRIDSTQYQFCPQHQQQQHQQSPSPSSPISSQYHNNMDKTHTRVQSVTYSEHTKHCSGFVLKVRNRDKLKTVRIHTPEEKKTTARPYRNVALGHIKNLRNKSNAAEDPSPVSTLMPFSRYSFLYDDTLSHSLLQAKPLKNSNLNPLAPTQSQNSSPEPTRSSSYPPTRSPSRTIEETMVALSRNHQTETVLPANQQLAQLSRQQQIRALSKPNPRPFATASTANDKPVPALRSSIYKDEDVIQLQNLLPMGLKQDFAMARISNQSLTITQFLSRLPPTALRPEIKDALDTLLAREAAQKDPLEGAFDPNSPGRQRINFSWDDLNFKPPRVMALDIGTQYIGVAISDDDFKKAIPAGVINLYSEEATNQGVQSLMQEIRPSYRVDPQHLAQQLNNFRKRFNVVCTCIGLPQSDFNEHMVHKIKAFTGNMINLHGLGQGQFEVCYIDEHHTTQLARKKILDEEERDGREAEEKTGYSFTGHGGERKKMLKTKSKHHDDQWQKGKDIDAQAAAIILERFIELSDDVGDRYMDKVQNILIEQMGPNQLHTM